MTDERALTKRTDEETGVNKVADKIKKLAKFGLKFQSAGTLISIGDSRIERDTPLCKNVMPMTGEQQQEKRAPVEERRSRKVKIGGVIIDVDQKASYTTMWEKAGEGGKKDDTMPLPSSQDKAPPPLMSRQRELIMEKAANLKKDDDDDDDDDVDFTAKKQKKDIIKKPVAFTFKITKK